MEHRWGQRYPVDIPVQVATGCQPLQFGRLIDLSTSGGSIHIPVSASLFGSKLLIALSHPQLAAVPVLPADIVRRHPHGVAVEWREFAPPPVLQVLRLLRLDRPEWWRALLPPSESGVDPAGSPAARASR